MSTRFTESIVEAAALACPEQTSARSMPSISSILSISFILSIHPNHPEFAAST